jgi:hypothetical protein
MMKVTRLTQSEAAKLQKPANLSITGYRVAHHWNISSTLNIETARELRFLSGGLFVAESRNEIHLSGTQRLLRKYHAISE